MPDDLPRGVRLTGRECPRCGSPLLCDGTYTWCSFSPGPGQTPCLYGIAEKVRLADAPR